MIKSNNSKSTPNLNSKSKFFPKGEFFPKFSSSDKAGADVAKNIESEKDFFDSMFDDLRASSLALFNSQLAVEHKDFKEPVSKADRQIEQLIVARLALRFPGLAVLAEEGGASSSLASGSYFSIDPIDGTRAFLSGMPTWGILLALVEDNVPRFSVLEFPCLARRYYASMGHSVLCDARVLSGRAGGGAGGAGGVGAGDDLLGLARLATSSRAFLEHKLALAYNDLSARCAVFHDGGDAMLYAALAEGRLDLVIEQDLKPYDYLPLMPLVRSAGGAIDFLDKAYPDVYKDFALSGGRIIIAARDRLLWSAAADALLALLQQHKT